jgi:hypothetical protein
MQFYTFCSKLFHQDWLHNKPAGAIPVKQNWINTPIKSVLIRMKLITIFLLAGCLQISAAGFSQNINITQKRTSLESVFKAIEKQTDYTFFTRLS